MRNGSRVCEYWRTDRNGKSLVGVRSRLISSSGLARIDPDKALKDAIVTNALLLPIQSR